jgi:hypothetical protein
MKLMLNKRKRKCIRFIYVRERFRQENKEIIGLNRNKQVYNFLLQMTEDKAIVFSIEKEKKEKQLRKEAFQQQVYRL